MSDLCQWRAVVNLLDRKIADAKTNSAILPSEVTNWHFMRIKARLEIAVIESAGCTA